MIELMILIFFTATAVVAVNGAMTENKIRYVDKMVRRGADINKVVGKK